MSFVIHEEYLAGEICQSIFVYIFLKAFSIFLTEKQQMSSKFMFVLLIPKFVPINHIRDPKGRKES